MGVGCGSKEVTPDEQVPSEFAGAPEWVLQGCGAYWGDDGGARLCGVGEARLGSSMSIARTKATSRARAEISRTLETKVKNMIKDFQEEVTDGESEMTAEQFSSTTVALSKATLNGTQVQQTWVSPSDRLYILVALDVEAFDASVREMDEMSDRLRTFIESRSRKSFEELEEQMEEY
jgi:ribosomal protein S20